MAEKAEPVAPSVVGVAPLVTADLLAALPLTQNCTVLAVVYVVVVPAVRPALVVAKVPDRDER